ncbi:MAG: hypothetical protein NTX45_28210 [Proteobacteria bacterium]|nr:hypothetical protein [Pseudomonadota bacterium]
MIVSRLKWVALLSNNIRPILERDDRVPMDSYIRNLPMAYDHAFDRKETRRSRFVFARHIANLLPLYGRSTGTGKPGMLFFNRGGEPVQFDPIADRKSNAHMLILGPTGSGKSALLVYDLLMVMAVHRPRVFIIEAGGSFSLLWQYFASLGLAVNQVTMRPGEDVSLPPFADALKLAGILPQSKGQAQNQSDAMEIDRVVSGADENADETPDREGEGREGAIEAGRDLLGEMEISARLMITGGDAHEDARLTRADRWLIQQAILVAVEQVKNSGRGQVLTEDVAHALRAMAAERPRAKDMADALGHFCTPGSLAAHFFNRPGTLWPDADVTIFEMGVRLRTATGSGLCQPDEPHPCLGGALPVRGAAHHRPHRRGPFDHHQPAARPLCRHDT